MEYSTELKHPLHTDYRNKLKWYKMNITSAGKLWRIISMKTDDILEITRFHVRDSVVLTSPLLFTVLVFTFNNLTI